jgi:hypothetical protein
LWLAIPLLLKARTLREANAWGSGSVALFLTTLPTDGFVVEDVLDLSHGRGAEDRGAGF